MKNNLIKCLKNIGKEVNEKISNEDLYTLSKNEIIYLDKEYRKGYPKITDDEFDELYIAFVKFEKENIELKTEDSPSEIIYDTIIDNLNKVKHESFMGSQEKMKTEEDLIKFIDKVNGEIAVDYKLDGITIVLRYVAGQLRQAITRGNGIIGEDVTHAVKGFKGVPLTIDYYEDLEVRAEAIMNYEDFEKVNDLLSAENKYSNPRNLVSGTVRNLDGNIAASRGLRAIVFDITKTNKTFKKGTEALEFLKNLGFEVVETKVFSEKEKEELIKYCLDFENTIRPNIEYMIDGLVLKANSIEKRLELGEKTKYPNWSSAFKFTSLEARSKLLDVIWNTGKTGKLAPVGIIEPVEIDNVNIGRATLNNMDWINDLDLKYNSEIIVARANDVIPKVISVVHNGPDSKTIEAPKTCPSCNGPVVKDGAHLFCYNESCPSQVVEKIIAWCHRDRLNIPGLGIKVIEQLYDKGLVKNIVDLYYLKDKEEEFLSLERQGQKSFDNAIKAIENSKSNDFLKVIYGLNIDNLGSVASETFVKEFKSFDNILEEMKNKETFKEKLLELPDFGEAITTSIINFFDNPKNVELLRKLEEVGFNLTTQLDEPDTPQDSPIEGKAFVITGTLSQSRSFFKQQIKDLGGLVRGSVSSKTDYVLVGENAGSKETQAQELGITILTEDEFNKLIK